MKERRRNVRIPCRLEIKADVDNNWLLIYSKDIGTNGMKLVSETEVEKLKKIGIDEEAKVSLSFYIPAHNGLIKVSGKIVYIDKGKDSINKKEISIIGIQFGNLSEHVKKELSYFILSKKKKPL